MSAETTQTTQTLSFAVIGADGVYLDRGGRLALPAGPDAHALPYWLEAMAKRHIDALWLHPSCGWLWQDSDADAAEAAGWTVHGAAEGEQGAPWWTAAKAGQWGMRHLILTAYEDRAPWREAPDAATLRDALLAYRDALGLDYRRSPGATGTRLVRALHSDAHATKLDLPSPLPPRLRHGAQDGPLLWRRPLTPAETKKRWFHSFDINGQYLAACSSIALGVGSPIWRGQDDARRLILAALDDPKGHRLPPGYWRVDARYTPPAGAPSPLEGVKPSGWITTPTLRLLLDLNAQVAAREAWVWPESRRYLESWYARLREGRAGLMTRHDAAGRLALATLKTTYTTTVNGWMRSDKWDRSEDALYRPDWSDAIRAQARANEYRTIARVCETADACPFFAVGADALYLVSDEPDAEAAAPAGVRLGPQLGHFKVKDSLPLAEVRTVRMARWTVNGLQRELNGLREIHEREEERRERRAIYATA